MPFVFDQTDIDGAEDADDLIPRVEQFEYTLPTPEYRGVIEPARFSILPVERTEGEPAVPQSPPTQRVRKGIMRLFRGLSSSADRSQPRQISIQERQRRAKLKREQDAQCIFSILVPALRSIGVKRAYCRYDGGNDEGFARLDRFEMVNGAPFADDLLGPRLHEMNVHEKLRDVKITSPGEGVSVDREAAELASFARETLIQEWAYVLLGTHFGTGDYVMYGAFTVDLDACTITDDPKADPIVENIQIKNVGN
jgi:hypothetical protein